MEATEPIETVAIRMLAAQNLHQHLWLPETASHSRVRVTFSTTSNFDLADLPVILFIGPMFGTRYMSLMFDKLARAEGVRVICVDSTWLETVPVLLKHLNIQHVYLVTHSAGTLYTLNTLAHLRDYLDPQTPFVAFLGPWVHCDQSSQILFKAASFLPAQVISRLSDVTEFVQQTIMPASVWSGGMLSNLLQASKSGDANEWQEQYGVDEETGTMIDQLRSQYIFAEGIAGGGDEAVLLLKKADPGAWGACEDYNVCVKSLASVEKARHDTTAAAATGLKARLQVRIHFAGSDMMIGSGGRQYYEQCWKQTLVAETMDVKVTEWPEANHETVLLDWSKGAMKTVFQEIRRIHAS